MSKFLDNNGLLYLWSKIRAAIPKKTSDITNDSGFITSSDIPEGAAASTTTPAMNGTASSGSELTFARGDHVHPHDTSKVDVVSGKQLSTNDYTTEEKQKLAGIAAGAGVNVNADWNASSGDAQILNKPTIPTNNSQLSNGAGYATTSELNTAIADFATESYVASAVADLATETYVTNAVANAAHLKREKVASLPSIGGADANTIYMVAKTGSAGDVFNEYMAIDGAFELVGNSEVDLTGYMQTSDMVAITNSEIDTIAAS